MIACAQRSRDLRVTTRSICVKSLQVIGMNEGNCIYQCIGVWLESCSDCSGGIRKITVPSSLGFGERGISLRGTEHVPDKQAEDVPSTATLEYTVELIRVSIAPS
jgi:hypothetical protein